MPGNPSDSSSKRLLRVIVAGGVSLTTPAITATSVGCTESSLRQPDSGFPREGPDATPPPDTGRDTGFPREGVDATPPADASDAPDGFPREGPAPFDAGVDVPGDSRDGDARDVGFPREGVDATPPRDTGVLDDASDGPDVGFPREGPAPLDSGVDAPGEIDDAEVPDIGFPREGPAPVDSGVREPIDDDGGE